MAKETGAQRGLVSGLRPHSWEAEVLKCKARWSEPTAHSQALEGLFPGCAPLRNTWVLATGASLCLNSQSGEEIRIQGSQCSHLALCVLPALESLVLRLLPSLCWTGTCPPAPRLRERSRPPWSGKEVRGSQEGRGGFSIPGFSPSPEFIALIFQELSEAL